MLRAAAVVLAFALGSLAADGDARAASADPFGRASRSGGHGALERAGAEAPLVLLSYFETRDLERLAGAVERAGIPSGVPVYIGSYGVNPIVGDRVRALRAGRYAPMFTIQPSAYWTRRRLDPAEEDSPPGEYLSGQIPPFERQAELSRDERVNWGRELGRRFRDRLRQMRRAGAAIDAWQFDEVPHTAVGPRGAPVLEFTRGVLEGLVEGRLGLGDRPEQGFVYVAPEALALASEPVDEELGRFWGALDAACLRFVGEEYPEFVGDPVSAAFAHSAGQRALAHGDAVRRSIAARYMPGVTPGYRLGVDLGGNVSGAGREEVNAWREAFIAERARHGVAGFAAYHFRFENSATEVMEDVLRALGRGVEAADGPRPSRAGRRAGRLARPRADARLGGG